MPSPHRTPLGAAENRTTIVQPLANSCPLVRPGGDESKETTRQSCPDLARTAVIGPIGTVLRKDSARRGPQPSIGTSLAKGRNGSLRLNGTAFMHPPHTSIRQQRIGGIVLRVDTINRELTVFAGGARVVIDVPADCRII